MKVSIITRAFNRLEYTVQVVRNVNLMANNANYEHIIVDQNSSDGTTEWLKSMEHEGYYNLKVKYNNVNSGDAGGMKDGFSMVSDDSDIIIQLDNDLSPITDDFINKIISVFKDETIGALMLRRVGVKNKLPLKNLKKTINGIDLYESTPFSYAFRRDLLDRIDLWYVNEKIGWVRSITSKIKSLGYDTFKTPNIELLHIDGHESVTKLPKSTQRHRYPKYFSGITNNTNYKKIDYNNE